ncbi:MAG: hypothetical protein ACE5QV_05110, partial [Fidelibacterota bacterium]
MEEKLYLKFIIDMPDMRIIYKSQFIKMWKKIEKSFSQYCIFTGLMISLVFTVKVLTVPESTYAGGVNSGKLRNMEDLYSLQEKKSRPKQKQKLKQKKFRILKESQILFNYARRLERAGD